MKYAKVNLPKVVPVTINFDNTKILGELSKPEWNVRLRDVIILTVKDKTTRDLSTSAGISKAYLSQIESGKRKGSTKILSAIANSLDLTLDDIV